MNLASAYCARNISSSTYHGRFSKHAYAMFKGELPDFPGSLGVPWGTSILRNPCFPKRPKHKATSDLSFGAGAVMLPCCELFSSHVTAKKVKGKPVRAELTLSQLYFVAILWQWYSGRVLAAAQAGHTGRRDG